MEEIDTDLNETPEGPSVKECLEKEDTSTETLPFSVVWSTIPVLSSLCPILGHVGICDSQGRIWDFHGHNTVRVCLVELCR